MIRSLGRSSKEILRRHDSFTFEDNDRGMQWREGCLWGDKAIEKDHTLSTPFSADGCDARTPFTVIPISDSPV
jgi:hypothetical protein